MKKKFELINEYAHRAPQRKSKCKISFIAAATALVFIIVCTASYIGYYKRNYRTVFYRVTSNLIAENVRLVFLSDIHMREYGENNEKLIKNISQLSPDLIILGGDMITNGCSDYTNMLSLCRSLAGIAPTYGVLGNHEDEQIFYGGDTSLVQKFSDTGVRILRNEKETLEIGKNKIELVGIEGSEKNFDKYGAKTFMDSLDDEYEGYRICIAHVPMLFADCLKDYSFNLGLAGHTHGGLIRIPKIGRLYSAEEGFFPEYAGGEYTLENKAELIVGCGLGDSSLVPRIYNPPELDVIDLNWY